jgi:hypothetical protein
LGSLRFKTVKRSKSQEAIKNDEAKGDADLRNPRRDEMFIETIGPLDFFEPIYGRHKYFAPKGAGKSKRSDVSINITPLCGFEP